MTLPNFTFGKLFMWIEANNEQIWLPMGYMSDSELCSNWIQLDLNLILVNFSCELGQIVNKYEQWSNQLQLYLISLLVNSSYELGQIISHCCDLSKRSRKTLILQLQTLYLCHFVWTRSQKLFAIYLRYWPLQTAERPYMCIYDQMWTS